MAGMNYQISLSLSSYPRRSDIAKAILAFIAGISTRGESTDLILSPYLDLLGYCWKPSVQKLVSTNSSDCLIHLNEEVIHTAVYSADVPRVIAALRDLEAELDSHSIDNELRRTALVMAPKRAHKQHQEHECSVGLSVLNWTSILPC